MAYLLDKNYFRQMANPEHIAKLKEGVAAWNKWRDKNPGILIDLEEAFRGEPLPIGPNDLTEGINLKGANLEFAHLEGAMLIKAQLEHANLKFAKLNGAILWLAQLQHADLGGAVLERANLREACLEHAILISAELEHATLTKAQLEHASLNGANLNKASLRDAKICGASLLFADIRNTDVLGLVYLYPLSLRNLGYRKRIMRRRFAGLRGLDSCYGNRVFTRDAADQDYIDTLEGQWNSLWGRFWFWVWGLTDYGCSFMSIIVFASVLVFAFGAAYSHWPQLTASAKDMDPNRFTPYYFSIVTYTTLGFGDVRPNGLAGEILVCIEVVFGYITLGLLLAVLGNKVARRS